MIDSAKEKLGGVDILVNNAGQMYSGRFAALDDNAMKTQLDTKLFGFLRAIRGVYPMMKAQNGGVSSIQLAAQVKNQILTCSGAG